MTGLKSFQLFLMSVFWVGCSIFGGLQSNAIPPTLIQKTAFPPLPSTVVSGPFNLKTELLVSKTGSVLHAELRNSSGDAKWDSAAVQSILQWKYSPATLNGVPIQMKISQTARVIYTPPLMMFLSQIVCTNAKDADSVFASLQAGESFDSLASVFSPPNSVVKSGYLGEVDVRQYPDEIQQQLQRLAVNKYSRPLPLGSYYAIFKRHHDAKMESLPH